MFIIAQVFSILGMLTKILSFQWRKRAHVLLMTLISSGLYVVSYVLLDAPMGALLNLMGVFRAWLFGDQMRQRLNTRTLTGLFTACYSLSYAATFLLLGKEPTPGNLILELLPVVAMVISTLGFAKDDAKSVRTYSAVSFPLWLVYNTLNASIGGILGNLFGLLSSVTAYLRLDKKKTQCP